MVKLLSLWWLANSNASQIEPSYNSPSLIKAKTLYFFLSSFAENASPQAIPRPCPNDPVSNSTPGTFSLKCVAKRVLFLQ